MSQSKSPVKVLALGLPLPKEMDPNGDMVQKMKAGAAQKNIELTTCLMELADQSHEETVNTVKESLKAGPYDMVSLGFGVRGNPKLTVVFELLVNTCSQGQPGVRFSFPTHPQELFEAVERVLA